MSRILVIDNYDSFVYNLVQYLGELGAEPLVFRNDELTLSQVDELNVRRNFDQSWPWLASRRWMFERTYLARFQKITIFGVCLGMQCMGEVFGGVVDTGPRDRPRQDLTDSPPQHGGFCRSAQPS